MRPTSGSRGAALLLELSGRCRRAGVGSGRGTTVVDQAMPGSGSVPLQTLAAALVQHDAVRVLAQGGPREIVGGRLWREVEPQPVRVGWRVPQDGLQGFAKVIGRAAAKLDGT